MPDTVTKTTDVLLRPEFAPKVLDGTKGMTRRSVNPQPTVDGMWWTYKDYSCNGEQGWRDGMPFFGTAYGQPGDHLRFLTTWAVSRFYDNTKPLALPSRVSVWTAFEGDKPKALGKSRPGRFMPLWMRKRLPVFELTAVRVEQLGEITSADVVAEGFPFSSDLDAFKATWADINGKWQPELWVWVLSFRRVESPDA